MRATRFIVIGCYDHERNSWIPDGDIRHVVSCHHAVESAARALFPAHRRLGGCDGGDLLTAVARRLDVGEQPDESADTYEHAGRTYEVLGVWDTHEAQFSGQAFDLVPA